MLSTAFDNCLRQSVVVFQPKLFYHNYKEPKGSFTHSLWSVGIPKALTLHPVKQPTYMFRLHQFLLTLKISNLQRKLRSLQREIDSMDRLLEPRDLTTSLKQFRAITEPLNRSTQRADGEVSEWDCVQEFLYSTRSGIPRKHLPSYVKSIMPEMKEEVGYNVLFSIQTFHVTFRFI